MTFCSHPGEEAPLIALQVRELPGVCEGELGLISPATQVLIREHIIQSGKQDLENKATRPGCQKFSRW